MLGLRFVCFAALAALAGGCTCDEPRLEGARDAGVAAPSTPDASSFGCVDAQAQLLHTVAAVEGTLGACERDADCVGDHLRVDCPRATFVACGYAYAADHEPEARARVDDAAESVCTRLEEPCAVRALDGTGCPPSTVRCLDGRCRVVSAPGSPHAPPPPPPAPPARAP